MTAAMDLDLERDIELEIVELRLRGLIIDCYRRFDRYLEAARVAHDYFCVCRGSRLLYRPVRVSPNHLAGHRDLYTISLTQAIEHRRLHGGWPIIDDFRMPTVYNTEKS